jgi:hypothetical protein
VRLDVRSGVVRLAGSVVHERTLDIVKQYVENYGAGSVPHPLSLRCGGRQARANQCRRAAIDRGKK